MLSKMDVTSDSEGTNFVGFFPSLFFIINFWSNLTLHTENTIKLHWNVLFFFLIYSFQIFENEKIA